MIIIIALFLLFLFCFPLFRCFIFHFPQFIIKRLEDLYYWFVKLKCNEAEFLGCLCFVANTHKRMGSGKTLSMCNYVIDYYNKYNDKYIFVDGKKVKQKIIIFSNIKITGVPTIDFTSFEQFNEWNDIREKLNKKNSNCYYKCLFAVDEIGILANNRQYKGNFSLANIQALLQQRHTFCMGLLCSVQSMSLTDKLLRTIFDFCISSELIGLLPYRKRFLLHNYYIAAEMEELDETLIKPVRTDVKFLYNKNYNCYNTYAIAELLTHNKNFISDDEIAARLIDNNNNYDGKSLSRKGKKILKK